MEIKSAGAKKELIRREALLISSFEKKNYSNHQLLFITI